MLWQMVASVLSKKMSGSTHLVIDMPIGPSAKVRSEAAGIVLSDALLAVARGFGLERGSRPDRVLSRSAGGIGPALEARDVLAVLRNNPGLEDLRSRAIELAGAILELGGRTPPKMGAGTSPRKPWRAAVPGRNSSESAKRRAGCANRPARHTAIR